MGQNFIMGRENEEKEYANTPLLSQTGAPASQYSNPWRSIMSLLLCLSVCLSVCLSRSVRPSLSTSICPSLSLPVRPSPSVRPPLSLSLSLLVLASICLNHLGYFVIYRSDILYGRFNDSSKCICLRSLTVTLSYFQSLSLIDFT